MNTPGSPSAAGATGPSDAKAPVDIMENILNVAMQPEARRKIRENLRERQNTPNIRRHLAPPTLEELIATSSARLWIEAALSHMLMVISREVDRILEPQTLAHFIASLTGKDLPGGVPSESDFSREEIYIMYQPYSEWAPAPFNATEGKAIERVMGCIGSIGDSSRMLTISTELHAMKSRLWEGVMPVSARCWRDRGLDLPENFSAACRIISMAICVFIYLNNRGVRAALMETYNRIYDELSTFEKAFGAKRAAEGKPAPQICKLWHDFMRAHFDVMTKRTHAWIMDRVELMKARVLEQLAVHEPAVPDVYDDVQWTLTNMWQDLSEISGQADYSIFLPMYGYKGSSPRPDETDPYDFRTQPLSPDWPDLSQRQERYHLRRRHMLVKMTMDEVSQRFQNASVGTQGIGNRGIGTKGIGVLDDKAPRNDPSEIVKSCRGQETARRKVSAEFHGEPVRYKKEPWASILWDTADWGFVAYRTYPSCSDDEWSRFVAKFEADIGNWGRELTGIDGLRERSKIHWIDTKELEVDGHDIEALKSAFNTFVETPGFPADFSTEIFLVADEASINSYSTSHQGGFILAIDVEYDPKEGLSRPDESPGYDGTLRVLGSVLWDDLSALVATQTQHTENLWPLAMNHPDHVYVGYVTEVHPGEIGRLKIPPPDAAENDAARNDGNAAEE